MELLHDMIPILTAQAAALGGLKCMLTRKVQDCRRTGAPAKRDPKQLCEDWFLVYSCLWIACFAYIVCFRVYLVMGKWSYLGVCGLLAAPLLLQPWLAPSLTGEADVPFFERHCTKATAWIALYSYLGNYYGTHYFYCVLDAKYTMPFLPAHQLNGVPISMYFATHFYFSFYHALANKVLRCTLESYMADIWRSLFLVALVASISYVVAFMETFSISAFPYYTFADRRKVYTIGSAFYALYLMVSFPMFMRLDKGAKKHTFFEACFEALGTWMLIMCLLDAVRLFLGVEFRMAS